MSTSFVLFGLAINDWIAVGRAHLVNHATFEVSQYHIDPINIGQEQERLLFAKKAVAEELQISLASAQRDLPAEVAAMIEVHQLILNDPSLIAASLTRIATEYCNAEWALVASMERLAESFEKLDNTYMAGRADDIRQITERVLKHLQGTAHQTKPPNSESNDPLIIVSHDLSPGELIALKNLDGHRFQLGGFITDAGGENAHVSILARSQETPAIVGIQVARRLIEEGEWLIIDGEIGAVIVNPDEFSLAEYQSKAEVQKRRRTQLQRLANLPTRTLDGENIQLHANIESPADVALAIRNGASGIGLFRSEFLFMYAQELPSEERQFSQYRQVLATMHPAVVTIRTLDAGGDKLINLKDFPKLAINPQQNSQLGLRAIRLCLAYPEIFRTQIRALLRASVYGQLRILLPMITTEEELITALAIIDECRDELRREQIQIAEHIPIGIMLEVPATVYLVPHLAKKIQFLSLGTNDLLQYSLAVDRGDSAVGYLYDPLHSGILHLIALSIQSAKKFKLPLSICGEMASDPDWTRFLIGLGLRDLSMNASHLLDVKQKILSSEMALITQKIKRWKQLNHKNLVHLFNEINKPHHQVLADS